MLILSELFFFFQKKKKKNENGSEDFDDEFPPTIPLKAEDITDEVIAMRLDEATYKKVYGILWNFMHHNDRLMPCFHVHHDENLMMIIMMFIMS